MTFQPKGSMCGTCKWVNKDCSGHDFASMRKHKRDGDTTIVICSEWVKREKTVCLPIVVPEGPYCWDGVAGVCHHFDNEPYRPICSLGMGEIEERMCRYIKPSKCYALREVT